MSLNPKENLLRALAHDRPAYIPYWSDGSWQVVDYIGRRPPISGVDEWGVTWEPLPEGYQAGHDEPLLSYPARPAAASLDELLARPLPVPPTPAAFADVLARVDRSATLAIGRHPAGPLDRLMTLLGAEQAMLALAEGSPACVAVLERIASYHVEIASRYMESGVEAAWLADDFAGQRGPLLRPVQWRTMILPGLARIIQAYRQEGLPVIFHTCGQAELFIEDLLAAGVTAFNLESAACDLAALKQRFGRRIAFVGGVSGALMQRATPTEVAAATRSAINTLGREGGLLLAPDQDLAFADAVVAAFTDTARVAGSRMNREQGY